MHARRFERGPARALVLLAGLLAAGCRATPRRPEPPAASSEQRLARALRPTWSPSPAATEPAFELFQLSPYVSADVFPFVEPATRSLRLRLALIEEAARVRGLPVRHNFQALYGSGFLRHNPVGNDLDAEFGVHLGPVRLTAGREGEAAGAVLDRMEQYLQALHHVFVLHGAPDLAVYNFRLLRDGRWHDREALARRMTASFVDVAARRPHAVLVDSLYGLRVPTVLSPDESYVHETTRIELLSNRVRTVDWMTAGLRGFQVMFHWYLDLEIADAQGRVVARLPEFPVHPTFVPSGKVLAPEENSLGTVPVDRASAAFVSRTVLGDPDVMREERIHMAEALLSEVDRTLASGDPLKALKRLHQAGDALEPALPREVVERLSARLRQTLFDPRLVTCGEVGKLAENARSVFRVPPLLALYTESYDLQRLLMSVLLGVQRGSRLGLLAPGRADPLTERLGALQRGLSGFPTGEQRAGAAALLTEVHALADECEAAAMPPRAEVVALHGAIRGRLLAAGLQPLPVYGMPDGTLGVMATELGELPAQGLTAAAVAAGAPRFTYRVIAPADVPRDNRGRPVDASWTLWLRPSPTAAEEASWRALNEALDRDDARFVRVTDPDAGLREAAGRDFLARFGAAGRRAWDRSRSGGDALLALLLVGDDRRAAALLDRHLALSERAGSVGPRFFPPFADGDAAVGRVLGRALSASGERALSAVAAHRASDGRRGLDAAGVSAALDGLSELLDALDDLGSGRGVVESATARDEGWMLRVRGATGNALIRLVVRARREEGAQARVAVSVDERDGQARPTPWMMRFDLSGTFGAGIDVQPGTPRDDWAVHGALADNPLVTDHHFFDDLPAVLRRPTNPRARWAMSNAFAEYVETRFVPTVLGGLRRAPGVNLPAPSPPEATPPADAPDHAP